MTEWTKTVLRIHIYKGKLPVKQSEKNSVEISYKCYQELFEESKTTENYQDLVRGQ